MKKLRILLFLCLLFAAVSCASSRYLPKDLVAGIDRLAVLAPLSYVDYLAEDGNFYPDDSLSAYSQDMLVEALMTSGLPVSKFIPVEYLSLGQSFENTVASLSRLTPKQVPYLEIPPEIDRLLEANGERYGVMVFNTGFVRDIKEYRKELAKDVALTVVTTALAVLIGGGISTYGAPEKNISQMFAIIYDAQENRAVYYNNTAGANESRSPLDPASLRKQVDFLFKPLIKPAN